MWPLILLGLLFVASKPGPRGPRMSDLPRAEGKMYPAAHALPFRASSPWRSSPVGTQNRLSPKGIFVDEFGRAWGGGTPSLMETLGAGAQISGVPGLVELADTLNALGGLWGQLASSPLWDIYISGAYYMPGGGPLVSAGMRMAVELGRGASLEDASIASAREALPPGPARSAFDVAVGARDLDSVGREELRKYVSEELGPAGVVAYDEGMRRYG
jgi:hypothetical protein